MKIKNVSTATVAIQIGPKGYILAPEAEMVIQDTEVEKNTGLASMVAAGTVIQKVSNEAPGDTTSVPYFSAVNAKLMEKWFAHYDHTVGVLDVSDDNGVKSAVEVEDGVETDLPVTVVNSAGVPNYMSSGRIFVVVSASDGIEVEGPDGVSGAATSGFIQTGFFPVKMTATDSGTITITNDKSLTNQNVAVTIRA